MEQFGGEAFYRADDQPILNISSNSHQEKERFSFRAGIILEQLVQKYPETFRIQGPRLKQIALTFDDVPDIRFTPDVLDILKSKGVKATFFAIGSSALMYPKIMARIHKEGHAVGNHSYNHPLFAKLSLQQFQRQISRTNRILHSIIGVKPHLIRPPYGFINERQLRWARDHHYKVINWNVDSLDWKGLGKEEIRRNVLSQIAPGAIVLMHAGGGKGSSLTGTVQALPRLIDTIRDRGYQLVTLPQMMRSPLGK